MKNFKKILSLILVFAIVMALMPETRADERYFVGEYEMVKANIKYTYNYSHRVSHFGKDYMNADGPNLYYTATALDGPKDYAFTKGIKTLNKFDILNMDDSCEIRIKYSGKCNKLSKIRLALISDFNPKLKKADISFRLLDAKEDIMPENSVYLTLKKDGNNLVCYWCKGDYYGEKGSDIIKSNNFFNLTNESVIEVLNGGAHLTFYHYLMDPRYEDNVNNILRIHEIKYLEGRVEDTTDDTIATDKVYEEESRDIIPDKLEEEKESGKDEKSTSYYLSGHRVNQINSHTNDTLTQLGDAVMMGGRLEGDGYGCYINVDEKIDYTNKRIDFCYTMYTPYKMDLMTGINNTDICQTAKTYSKVGEMPKIPSNTTIYSSIEVNEANNIILENISTKNYYDKSDANPLYSKSSKYLEKRSKLKNASAKLSFKWNTTDYALNIQNSDKSYMVVHELKIRDINADDASWKVNAKPVSTGHKDPLLEHINTASDWAKEEIFEARNAGLYTEAMLKDDFTKYTTREEFSDLVMKLFYKLGGRVETSKNPFTDTNNPEIIKAYNAGIINGVSEDKFDPYTYITREQFCTLIVRTLKATSINYDSDVKLQKDYVDINMVSPWAMDSVRILNGHKIMNGDGTNLYPKDRITKEMALVMLYRVYLEFK